MSLQEGRFKEVEPHLKRIKFTGSYYEEPGVFFFGTATIDLSTGQFVGLIEDAGLISDIVGEKHDVRICFVKLYRDRKTNLDPINYEFQREGDKWIGQFEYGGGTTGDRGSSRIYSLSLGDSLMSPRDYQQLTEEVSNMIGERRGEMAERLRKISRKDEEESLYP